MKKVVTFLLATLMLFLLVSCSSTPSDSGSTPPSSPSAEGQSPNPQPGEKVKISILRPGDETKVRNFLEPTIKEFMEKNQDIEVTIQYESWGGWIAKYPTFFQAGTQPDVIFWWDKALNDMHAKGKILPIEQYVDSSILEEIPDAILDACKIDGVLYHVPVDICGFVMYYRKDIFEQAGLDPNSPPKTWDELLEICKQIQNNTNVDPLGIPGKAGTESLHEFIAQFITQSTGLPMLDENNNMTFNNDKGLASLNYINQLMEYVSPNFTDYGRGDVRTLFKDGKIAIALGDSVWAVPEYQATFGNDLENTECGIAAPPVSTTGNYNWAGMDGWAIAQEEHAEEAGKLINYLCSPEITYRHHKVYGGMPFTSYELEQDAFKYDFWNVFNSSVSDFEIIQRIGKHHPAPSAFYAQLEPIWQEMLMGNIDAQTALDQAEGAINDINSRYGID